MLQEYDFTFSLLTPFIRSFINHKQLCTPHEFLKRCKKYSRIMTLLEVFADSQFKYIHFRSKCCTSDVLYVIGSGIVNVDIWQKKMPYDNSIAGAAKESKYWADMIIANFRASRSVQLLISAIHSCSISIHMHAF